MEARFEILDIPGSGAQATVCIARDRSENRVRALKVLREDFHSESDEAQRVRDEGRILERLRHPALPRVYEHLELAGRQVLVMDFVDGPSVAWLIRRMGALPGDVVLEIVRQVAVAVDYAYTCAGSSGHPAKLVHRDLTLANLLLHVDGIAKVLDFGMARAEFVDREAQTIISLRGTPGYMAPEGLRAVADNPGLDVYSLGVGLLVMCTGHLPVLSRKQPRHDEGLEELLALLEEKTDSSLLTELARTMCAFHVGERPSMAEVVQRIPGDPDRLVAFVADQVAPLHRERKRIDPLVHRAYPELAFLEGLPVGEGGDSAAQRADQIVRRFLRRPQWMERTSDLKWLLTRYPAWTAAPFLEALEPLEQPWWKLGRARVHPRSAVVCLCALSHRRGASVDALVLRLRRRGHPAVVAVAGAIAKGQVVPLEHAETFDWSK